MDIALQAIEEVATLVETIEETVNRIITAIRECASKMMKQLKSILKTAEVTLSAIDVDYMDYVKVKIMVETGKKNQESVLLKEREIAVKVWQRLINDKVNLEKKIRRCERKGARYKTAYYRYKSIAAARAIELAQDRVIELTSIIDYGDNHVD